MYGHPDAVFKQRLDDRIIITIILLKFYQQISKFMQPTYSKANREAGYITYNKR